MKLPKYVKHYVDRRDDKGYFYLRRPGHPLVRLPGLPWSPGFMAAREAALAGSRTAIGAGRIKPGSVAAVSRVFRLAEVLHLQERRHTTYATRHS